MFLRMEFRAVGADSVTVKQIAPGRHAVVCFNCGLLQMLKILDNKRLKRSIWTCFFLGVAALGQTPAQEQFFESHVRPVLANRCYSCHSSAQSGGLRLDSRDAALKGGKSGPALVPGKPEDSLLIKATSYQHERLRMPPAEKLEDSEISDLTQWVKEGAVWPASQPSSAPVGTGYQISPQQRAFWSFQSLKKSIPPVARLKNWRQNPVDAFILTDLDKRKLEPAPSASKRTLIRRATLDLTGLPPTPEQVDQFLADKSATAYEKLIDRLLASPEYGERWGRHWLDVVRYSDTAGDASDYPIPQAILYRDYVIAAFNQDKPYSQFLREQIAGDLLPASNEAEKWQNTIATGYLALSRRFNVNPLQNMHLTVDDTVDNLGKAFLGLTIACARCHDHKFDPIPNQDYYALYGIFQSSRYPFPGSEKNHRPNDLVGRNPEEMEKLLKPYMAEVYKLSGRIGKLEGEKRAYVEGVSPKKLKDILDEIDQLTKQRAPLLANMPKVDVAFAMAEGKPENAKIQLRGEPRNLGPEAPRGFLEILGGKKLGESKGSGRLELAGWVTDPANPLTARVMVNRIWQHHFGRGLVATPSDFGKRGIAPTHPELLDYLANRFIESGWSVKSMHRLLMLSETYKLASEGAAKNLDIDANNDYLWKFSRRRLDAESLRDSLLMISGQLERGPSGPHPFPHMGTWAYMQHGPFADVYESNRRSVYLMTQRIQRHPYLGMFDGADPALSTASRSLTITPIQALFSMNSEFVHRASNSWANKLMESGKDESTRVREAFRVVLGRVPEPAELAAPGFQGHPGRAQPAAVQGRPRDRQRTQGGSGR